MTKARLASLVVFVVLAIAFAAAMSIPSDAQQGANLGFIVTTAVLCGIFVTAMVCVWIGNRGR